MSEPTPEKRPATAEPPLAAEHDAANPSKLGFDLELTAEGRALLGDDLVAPAAQDGGPAAASGAQAPAAKSSGNAHGPGPGATPSATPAPHAPPVPPAGRATGAQARKPQAPRAFFPTRLRPRLVAAGVASALVALVAFALVASSSRGGGPATEASATAKGARGGAPAAAKTASGGALPTPAVRPAGSGVLRWPLAQLAPLTASRVQQLDCASLRAGLGHEGVPPGLASWAQFRLAWACADAAALAQPPPALLAAGRRTTADGMLASAGRAGLALLHGEPMPKVHGRAGAWLRTPQGRLVQALADAPTVGRRSGAANRLRLTRSLGSDAQLLWAQLIHEDAPRDAERTLVELVAGGGASAIARASQALWTLEAYPALFAGLDHRAEALAPTALPRLLVQASPVHRRWLAALALRYHVARGALAEAHEVARLQLALAPAMPELRAEAEALARLLGVGRAAAGPQPPGPFYPGDAGCADGQPAAWRADRPDETSALQAALAAAQAAPPSAGEAAAAQAAAALLWRAPLTQDPTPLALLWLGALAVPDAAPPHAEACGALGPARALEALRGWIEARPQDDRAPLRLAEVGRARGEPVLVAQAYDTLLLRHPGHEGHTLALAGALLDAGEGARATALLRGIADKLSAAGRPASLLLQARAVGAQDPVQARVLIAEASRLRPDPRNDVLLADLLEAHGQLDEAALALARAATTLADDEALALRRAELALRQGALAQARSVVQEAVKRHASSLPLQEKLAEVAHRQGDLPGAATALKAAAGLPGAPARPLLALGRMQLLEMGQLSAGLETLRQALLREPTLAEAHYLQGLGLRDAGDERGMRESWLRYLQLDPKGPYAAEVHAGLRR